MNSDLLKLELRLLKLEEKVDILFNKKEIDSYIKEQTRLLSIHYSKLLASLRKEFKAYNPKNQINIKKTLVSLIPDKPMDIGNYINIVKEILNKHSLEFNLIEYEIWLSLIGFLVDNKVCKSFLTEEEYKLIIKALS